MKETKFRLWCENRNEWEQDAWCINPDGVVLCFYQGSMVPVKNETHIIEQYTGLKDKNGVEIYEGDILRFFVKDHNRNIKKYNMNPNRWSFIVSFENSCFGYTGAVKELHNPDDHEFSAFWCEEDKEMDDLSNTEIIGNIHENPELLNH